MKETGLPEQIVPGTVNLNAGATLGLTVMVRLFEVAVAGDAQLALDVMVQVTTWPFVRADVEKVSLFVPTLVAPIFHW